MQRFILRLLAPKIAHLNDVVLTRKGEAYWIQPGKLIQMRVIKLSKIKETE